MLPEWCGKASRQLGIVRCPRLLAHDAFLHGKFIVPDSARRLDRLGIDPAWVAVLAMATAVHGLVSQECLFQLFYPSVGRMCGLTFM